MDNKDFWIDDYKIINQKEKRECIYNLIIFNSSLNLSIFAIHLMQKIGSKEMMIIGESENR